MAHLIGNTSSVAFDLRSCVTRFDEEANSRIEERIRIDFDLPDGPVQVFGDPGELDALFTNLVLNVAIVMKPCGRLTVHIEPDVHESMPDEVELADRSQFLHIAIEDDGCLTIAKIFRRLLDPLINVAPALAGQAGALRWAGKVLFEEDEEQGNRIHLLLPYAASPEVGH